MEVTTSSSLNLNCEVDDWTGEGLYVGVQRCGFFLYSCKDIPKDFVVPDSPYYFYSIKDGYGDTVYSDKDDMSGDFKSMKYVKAFSTNKQKQMSVNRGGRYKVHVAIAPDLYEYTSEVDIRDEACARVTNTTAKVGNLLCPQLRITSGYPYDADALSGEKSLEWSVSPDGRPDDILLKESETFKFDTSKPLLAAVDTLDLPIDGLEPGKYIYTVKSDFAPACRTFEAVVSDTLRAEISFDKELYKLGTDAEAKLKIDMNFGYPYIAKDETSGVPTIVVSTTLLEESVATTFSDAAWAEAPLNYMAELSVALDKITEDTIAQYGGTVPFNLTVSFNGETQYTTTLELKIDGSEGVGSIVNDDQSHSTEYYNTMGVKVDGSYRGVVITGDGRKLIK
jgi:hypothetical protein